MVVNLARHWVTTVAKNMCHVVKKSGNSVFLASARAHTMHSDYPSSQKTKRKKKRKKKITYQTSPYAAPIY